MRTEPGVTGSIRRRGWLAILRGFLAVALLVVTTAGLWHEHSAAHDLDQGDTSCVICHAAQGLGSTLASSQHAFTAPRAAAPAPRAAARAPLCHPHTRYTARGPPVLA
jgi:hypothetical protein